MRRQGELLVVIVGLVGPWLGAARAESKNIEDASIEELLSTDVGVAATPASKQPGRTRPSRQIRSTPGIVYMLTREELVASGARDLLEALQLVPGITVHADVSGATSVALRGLWAQEGKVLVMLDGQELNETLFAALALRNHYPIDMIERIEVIRGPGSASYGGTAELGVINVITRAGKALHGATIATTYGQHATEPTDMGVVFSVGDATADDTVEASLHVAIGHAERTDRTYTDFAGTSISLRDVAGLDTMIVAGSLRYHDVRAHFLYDNYAAGSKTSTGIVAANAETTRFRSLLGDVETDIQLTDALVLRPHLAARLYVPWQVPLAVEDQHYNKSATRSLAGATLLSQPTATLSLVAGIEAYWDHAWVNDTEITGLQTLFGDRTSIDDGNLAVHAQAEWEGPSHLDLTGGVRFEYHSHYGANFAARAAATRTAGPLSVKLLYANAFRAPSIENINLGTNVRAERAQVAEAEVGVKLGDLIYVATNAFYTAIDRPIEYAFDPATDTESYRNLGQLATAGVEAVAMLRASGGFLNASYSLAVPTRTDSVYQVPDQPHRLLGMPLHKATFSGLWRAGTNLRLGGNVVVLSDRYGFLTPSEALDGTGTLGRLSPNATTTVWVGYDNLGVDGLAARIGIQNLFDTNVPDVQPYDGGQAPIPGGRREVFVQLQWSPTGFGTRTAPSP